MSTKIPALSLEQFVALNDELAALARAGVPLEKGLADLGRDLPGRLGAAAQSLGSRLEAGESLSQIIAEDKSAFPPAYRAAVLAGLRSGRLAAALEGISSTVRRTAELRRVVGFSLLYPLFVLCLAYFLFAFMSAKPLPTIAKVAAEFENADDGLSLTVGQVGIWAQRTLPYMGFAVPALALAWWFWSGRATWSGGGHGVFGRLPTAGKLLRAGRLATFVDVLALLVEQQVPLAEAVSLSAEACGDRRLRKAAEGLAARLNEGSRIEESQMPRDFPPLLGWMLVTGARHDGLARTLRSSAEGYRRQALRLADWLSIYLPMILTAGLGGTVVALYALMMLGPYFRILFNMSQPGS
jgi:type II secretory pathway component PulF